MALSEFMYPAAIAVSSTLVLCLMRGVALRIAIKWAEKTRIGFDDQVHEFTDQYLAQHELRKRIFRRFKKEGIEIPFPQRTVHIKQVSE